MKYGLIKLMEEVISPEVKAVKECEQARVQGDLSPIFYRRENMRQLAKSKTQHEEQSKKCCRERVTALFDPAGGLPDHAA